MKILVLTSSYPVPGSPLGPFIEYLNEFLVQEGCEVRVLIFSARGQFSRTQRNGIEVIEYPYSFFLPPKLHQQRALIDSVRKSFLAKLELPLYFVATLRTFLRFVGDCDIVQAHWFLPSGLIATMTRSLHRKPVVVTAHGKEFHLPENFIIKCIYQFIQKNSSRIVTVSNYMKAQSSKYGLNEEKFTVIPNGIPTEGFDVPRRSETDGSVALSYACRLVPEKRAQDVLYAFAKILKKSLPVDVNLRIIGDGPEYGRLTALSRELGIDSKVIFTGYLEWEEMPSIYASTDIFVNPTQEEGMATNNIEAMASGCCVVATRGVGNDEVIEDGKTGLIYPTGDIDRLATILDKLIRDANERRRLGEAAQQRAREYFHVRRAAGSYRALYGELLGG